LSEEEKEVYPVPSTKDTYGKPYLTPEKHLSYSTGFGVLSALGLAASFIL